MSLVSLFLSPLLESEAPASRDDARGRGSRRAQSLIDVESNSQPLERSGGLGMRSANTTFAQPLSDYRL